MRNWLLPMGVLLWLGSGWTCATAQAQNLDGRFHLGLETALVQIDRAEVEIGDSENDIESDRFGIAPRLGARLGYGVSRSAVIGLLVGVDRLSQDDDSTDSDTLRLEMVPYFRYAFIGGKARPYVGLHGGLLLERAESGRTEFRSNEALFGLSLGMMGFATRSVSIDPQVSFSYHVGGGEVDVPVVDDLDVDRSGFRVLFSLGLSAWI